MRPFSSSGGIPEPAAASSARAATPRVVKQGDAGTPRRSSSGTDKPFVTRKERRDSAIALGSDRGSCPFHGGCFMAIVRGGGGTCLGLHARSVPRNPPRRAVPVLNQNGKHHVTQLAHRSLCSRQAPAHLLLQHCHCCSLPLHCSSFIFTHSGSPFPTYTFVSSIPFLCVDIFRPEDLKLCLTHSQCPTFSTLLLPFHFPKRSEGLWSSPRALAVAQRVCGI